MSEKMMNGKAAPLEPPDHLVGKPNLKLVYGVWECGAFDCDCVEPYIAWQWTERIPNGITVYLREAIWTGTYVVRSESDGSEPDPDFELARALARFGIEVLHYR